MKMQKKKKLQVEKQSEYKNRVYFHIHLNAYVSGMV